MVGPAALRRTASLRWLWLALAFFAVLPDAAAQRRSSERSRDREEAREWYRSGRAALEAAEPEVALASFEQAYALYPHWASMVGMGLAYQALGQIEQALVCFEQGLSEGGADVSAEERADLQSRIAMLSAIRPPPPPPLPPPPPPRPIDEEWEYDSSDWFWGLVGTSGALLLAAIGTGSYTLVLDREYHMPDTPTARLEEIQPTGAALQVTTDVLLSLAGAAAVAAVVVLVVGDDDDEAASAVAVTGAPAGTGVGLTLRF